MASTSMEEARAVLVPTGEGSSCGAELANIEPVTVTLEELPPTDFEPPVPVMVRRMQTNQPGSLSLAFT